MADFSIFLPILLTNEGGWSDNPHDPGGATNKGITWTLFQACSSRLLGIVPTMTELQALTDQEAGVLYKALFWDELRCDEWESQDLANICCDFAVNSGVNRAAKLLQSVVNQISMGGHIAVDGVIGPGTMAALAAVNQANAYRLYRAQRIEQYQEIAAANPADEEFLAGWINRVLRFTETARA